MADHASEAKGSEDGVEDRTRTGVTAAKLGNALSGLLGVAITAVRIVGGVFALILVIHIVLFAFEANPDNPLTEFFANVADGLNIWFENLFTLGDVELEVLVNNGIAAVFWLVAAVATVRILQAVSPKSS